MKPKEHPLMLDCVERGVSLGLRKARKHCDDPTDAEIVAAISEAVMGEIAQAWTFDDEPQE